MVVIFCLFSILCVFAVLHSCRAYGGSTIVSPIGLFAAFFSFVYFILPALQEILKVNLLDHRFYGDDSFITIGTIALPLLYFWICAFFFWLQRPHLAPTLHLQRAALNPSPAERGLVPFLFLLQLASLIGTIQLIRSLSIASYAELLIGRTETLKGMGYFIDPIIVGYTGALILAASAFAAERMPKGWRAFAILVSVLGVAAPSAYLGRRLIALVGIAYLLLAFAILRTKKLPKLKVAFVVLLIVSVIAGMGVIRSQLFAAGTVDSEQTKKEIYSGKFLIEELTGSFGQLEWFGFLIEHPQRWQFQHGATYVSVIAAPIPRALWSDKPVGAGPVVNQAIYRTGEDSGGMTTGCVMEAYLNGGILGLILVASIHGILIGAVTRYGRRVRYRYQIVIYILLLACMGEMLIYGEFYGVAVRIAMLVLPVALSTRIVSVYQQWKMRSKNRTPRTRFPNAGLRKVRDSQIALDQP